MMAWKRTGRLLAGLACAAIPLSMTASCEPFSGTFSLFRFDDDHDHGFFDLFIDDHHYDDCFLFDCDDYYYEEIIIIDD
jgi:hypothetical protein